MASVTLLADSEFAEYLLHIRYDVTCSLKCQPSYPPNPHGTREKRCLNFERYNVVP